MMKRVTFLAALALAVSLITGTAHAVEVRYTTVGTFTGGDAAGTSLYLDALNGVVIDFEGAFDDFVDVPIGVTTQTSFGTFDTTGTTATSFVSVSSGFVLDIFQTAPTFGQTSFVGSLTGRIRATASQAWVQFDQPLESMIGLVIYAIANADRNLAGVSVPGRVNIAPPSTNQGETTLVGQITPIPEPSAMLLVGMGAVAPLALTLRHRRKSRATA